MTLNEQLRKVTTARIATGEPQSYMAGKCGVSPSMLSRFIAGKGSLSLEAASRLAAYVRVVLVPVDQTRDC
jgi:transcriptional regulator with XRE-family HTH domain